MPPLLTEQDIDSTRGLAADAPSSVPSSHQNAKKSSITDRIDDAIIEMHRDGAELKTQVFQIRTDIARLEASLKKAVIVTGIFVVSAIVLSAAGLSSVLLSSISENGKLVASNSSNVAGLGLDMAELRATMKNLNDRLDLQASKATNVEQVEKVETEAKLDCTNLPADVKKSALDFTIQFPVGSAKLTPAMEATLDSLAKTFALTPGRCMLIEGHTDATGKVENNMKLSEDRASSVANYIAKNTGIGRDRLVPLGKSSSSPARGLNPLDPKNRRVAFTLVTGF